MSEWWDSLLGIEKLFYFMAIPGTFLLILQTFGTLFGLFDNDIDMEADSDISAEGEASTVRFISVRTIVAFLTMFGWTGIVVLNINPEISILLLIIIATGVGLITSLSIAYLFLCLSKLQSSGNISYKNAINNVGEVYLAIPEKGNGAGKVHILIQGRFREVNAITNKEEIKKGAKVRVVDVMDDNTFIVDHITQS